MVIEHLRGDPRAVARLRAAVEQGDELWSVTVVVLRSYGQQPHADEYKGALAALKDA